MGGQVGCERRIEVSFVNSKKKLGRGGGGRGLVGLGGSQGRCERRIEVFVKIKKKKFFFLGGGVRSRSGGGGGGGGEGGW